MVSTLSLATIIARVESSNNPSALRFEWLTFSGRMIANSASIEILKNIAKINDCSADTAKMIYSTSWGFFQIMGFALYGDLGYEQPVATYFEDHDAQYAMFAKFVQARNINYGVNELAASRLTRVKFGTVYNGDGEDYANEIESSLKFYGVEISS